MPPQLSISPNSRVPFEVVYEDSHFVALAKPAGVVTQPGEKHTHDTLLNGAFARWGKQLQNLGKRRDFGLLHRLDRGTSGLVLIALTASAYDTLRGFFERRELTKRYWSLLSGGLRPLHGTCALPIAEVKRRGRKRALVITQSASQQREDQRRESPRGERRRRVNRAGARYKPQKSKIHGGSAQSLTGDLLRSQPALTHYQTLEVSTYQHQPVSLVACEIKTGRLHQIRAHMEALGAPVIGDFMYGGKRPLNLIARDRARDHLALHAGYLKLTHPCLGFELELYAPAPSWLQELSQTFGISLPREITEMK